MSYSFSVKAATKAEAVQKIAEELAKVVQQQPEHAADTPHARNAAEAFVNTLHDDADQDVSVSVSGSLSWMAKGEFYGANLSVNASLTKRA